MSEHAAVQFANEAFYLAFSGADIEAMDEVWADQDQITCIHPGWSPLIGRDLVMESWQAILANAESPAITCRNQTTHISGGVAYVVCYEEVDGGFLVATNIFVRQDGLWKMVHHQAGPAPGPPPPEAAEAPPLQ